MKPLFTFLSLSLLFTQVSAQELRKRYHLFKPVPKEQLRDFALDRPDVTESPQTVDAGHFQFEGDIIKWQKLSQDEKGTLLLWSGLYKLGLTNTTDLQVGYELCNIESDDSDPNSESHHGSLIFRLKQNFWGNDGNTKSALGVIPYISFLSGQPFSSREEIQYGIGFPFSYSISQKYELGAQSQFEILPDGNSTHYFSFFQTITFGGYLTKRIDYFIESMTAINSEENQYLFNSGLILSVNSNMKFDLATNVGLNKASPFKVYLGFSFRV